MKLFTAPPQSRLMLALAATLLASCAMPPKQAWRYIRQDGLFPYLAVELGKRPMPTQSQEQPNRYLAAAPPFTQSPAPIAGAPTPAAPHSDHKSATSPSPTPTPRLYLNNKPALTEAPASKQKETDSAPVKVMPKSPEPVVAQTPNPVKPAETTAAAPVKPKMEAKVEQPKPTPDVAKSTPPATKPAPDKPKTEAHPNTPSPANTAKVIDLPYGTPVPGRPGLVNSPYAGKMQLVDVTGLKSGQEVKCPYTGKLFRVPPGEQAKVEEKK